MRASSVYPSVSVIMAAYNAEPFILRSVQSLLAQTLEDFELLIVDDCSVDRTIEVVSSIPDPRLRILSSPGNLGPSACRNQAVAVARGRYLAIADADDIYHPTRLAQQVAHLERNPQAVAVATEMSILTAGRIRRSRMSGSLNPRLVEWMLHIGNPVGNPSLMFRAEALQKLGGYLREECKFGEDFAFLHRLLPFGDIHILPEHLVIYRLHDSNVSITQKDAVRQNVTQTLASAYRKLMDQGAERAADLIARHMFAAYPVTDRKTLIELGNVLTTLVSQFTNRRQLAPDDARQIKDNAVQCWWNRVILPSIRTGCITSAWSSRSALPALSKPQGPLAASLISGLLPGKRALRHALDRLRSAARPHQAHTGANIGPVAFTPQPVRTEDPPVLYVVVDTEAEFDWSSTFSRTHSSVHSISAQLQAQTIFNEFGIRPIYVVDYPVASQPEGYEPLRRIVAAHQCVVGAHLHPWTTPPFDEELSESNTFACNLDPLLELRKITVLRDQIARSFGTAPLFFKAGRYGVGPATFAALKELGFAVDLSILPLSDLRATGGPDFRQFRAVPYSTPFEVTSLPMTRATIGLLSPWQNGLRDAVQSRFSKTLRLPGLLARAKLLNTVPLTPEGVPFDEQKALIQALLARGTRHFVLHYHSPSLVPGNTPYVLNQADHAEFLRRLESICRFFVNDVGGLAGNPADLVPADRRGALWPAASHAEFTTAA